LTFFNLPPHLSFLIVLRVLAGLPAYCGARPARMNEIPMAAFAAPVHKSGFFQVGNQLSHFARHCSINLVSQLFEAVKYGKVSSNYFSVRKIYFSSTR
jgi:hypothetical protein